MALTDVMAKLVMGEIDDITNKIDSLSSRLTEQADNININGEIVTTNINIATDKIIEAMKGGITIEYDAIQSKHERFITDTIKTSTNSEIEALKKAIRLISDTEINYIKKEIENDKTIAIEEFETAIDNKLSAAFKNIDAANGVFIETKKSLMQLLNDTNKATEQYKTDLNNSIVAARQSIKVNWVLKLTGVFTITFFAVISGAFVYYNYIQHLAK